MNSVAEFLEHIKPKKNLIYRGQASLEWEVRSSLGRGHYGDRMDLVELEAKSIADFKRIARPFLKPHQIPDGEDQWRALMQHHGCPTRLIDFTHNPLTALFFATDPTVEKDGAVIIVDLEVLRSEPSSALLTTVHFPDHITDRISGQSGCFLQVDPRLEPLEGEFLHKLKIDKLRKYKLREELAILGICHGTLFPGLDGVCNDLRDDILAGISLSNICKAIEGMPDASEDD